MGGDPPVSIVGDMLAATLGVIEELGTTCTVTEVAATYSTDGTVAETTTAHAGVACSDLVDESLRYRGQDTSTQCTGTFYIPASGLTFTPAVGNRISYLSRSFEVLSVFAYREQATAIAWRLDVAEVAA